MRSRDVQAATKSSPAQTTCTRSPGGSVADQPASRAHASSGRKWRMDGAFSLSSWPSVPKTAPFLPRDATVKSLLSTNRVVFVRANPSAKCSTSNANSNPPSSARAVTQPFCDQWRYLGEPSSSSIVAEGMKGFWQGICVVWTTGASSWIDSSSGGGAKGSSWPAKGSSSCSSPMISSSSGEGSFSAFGDKDRSTLSSSSTIRFFFLRDTMGTSSSSSSALRFCGDSEAWSSMS
mmetsp:Transcript_1170/g.2631  ORF Transcript_1170/g.2631 Transcript_1170/m.2631 type:complete len:234 (+) Transcript_1170:512-1213(+)